MFDVEQRILEMIAERRTADISAKFICLDVANQLCTKHGLKADFFTSSKVFSFRRACAAPTVVTVRKFKWNQS